MHRVVCAWCDKILRAGTSDAISHGICEPCYEKQIRALDGIPSGSVSNNVAVKGAGKDVERFPALNAESRPKAGY